MSRSERGIAANRSIKRNTTAVPSTRTQTFYGSENSGQRSRSRSPSRNGSGSRTDPFTICATPASTIKRKRSSNSITATSSALDDTDRGQRIKLKVSGSGKNRIVAVPSSSSIRPMKDRERARAPVEYAQRLQPSTNVPPSDSQVLSMARRGVDKGKSRQVIEVDTPSPPPTPVYSGALAAAEYERMRGELETLKKTVLDGKKQLKKQNKTIEELKAQVVSEIQARETQEKLLVAASSKSRNNQELLQTIEASLQCQICIELISKPNLLAPCGHVFCLECLQQWFRSAPGSDTDDELDPEAQEQYILHREKSCPCCRAKVLRRPVPVFVVKSVANALRNAATSPVAAQGEEEETDPWKGLFLPDYDSSSEEDVDGYDSSEGNDEFFDHYSDQDDLDDAEVALAIGLGGYPQDFTHFYASASESGSEEDGSASDSDDPEAEGEADEEEEEEADDSDTDAMYNLAHWEPPRHVVESEILSNSMWKLRRRGCTPQLIALFNMRYTHDEGLIAHVSSLDTSDYDVTMGRNRLFLGWNIDIEPSDVEGEAEKIYMARQLRDIKRHPERWMLTERHGFPGRGIVDARRLAPVEEDAEIYDTSDSEAYSNAGDFM
ncbi:hypothetical protein B0H19DRAFT_1251208 [Mycena capillaripes]|nr:hypothetical protein B0H19DRAFT_1251208 [Mycena capillaripes]